MSSLKNEAGAMYYRSFRKCEKNPVQKKKRRAAQGSKSLQNI